MRTALAARLRQHLDDVERITAGLDDAALARRTAPEQWSLTELVCHLLRVQHLFEDRITQMIERDEPRFESYAPETDAGFADFIAAHRGRQAIDAFVEERTRFAERVTTLSPEQWQRRGRHPTFATFDVEFLVEYMVHHEAHHIYQMFMRRVPLGGAFGLAAVKSEA